MSVLCLSIKKNDSQSEARSVILNFKFTPKWNNKNISGMSDELACSSSDKEVKNVSANQRSGWPFWNSNRSEKNTSSWHREEKGLQVWSCSGSEVEDFFLIIWLSNLLTLSMHEVNPEMNCAQYVFLKYVKSLQHMDGLTDRRMLDNIWSEQELIRTLCIWLKHTSFVIYKKPFRHLVSEKIF